MKQQKEKESKPEQKEGKGDRETGRREPHQSIASTTNLQRGGKKEHQQGTKTKQTIQTNVNSSAHARRDTPPPP